MLLAAGGASCVFRVHSNLGDTNCLETWTPHLPVVEGTYKNGVIAKLSMKVGRSISLRIWLFWLTSHRCPSTTSPP